MVKRAVLSAIAFSAMLCLAPVHAETLIAQSSPSVRVTLPPEITIQPPGQPAAPVQPAQPAPPDDGLYANMDTSGNQPFVWFDLPGADPRLCQDACSKEARCQSFTYTAPGKYDYPNPRCWLKDSPGSLTPNVNVTSGFKR